MWGNTTCTLIRMYVAKRNLGGLGIFLAGEGGEEGICLIQQTSVKVDWFPGDFTKEEGLCKQHLGAFSPDKA